MIRRCLLVTMALAAFAFSSPAQLAIGCDHARLITPRQTLLVVWIGDQPIVVPETIGPQMAAPSGDFLEATYVAQSGVLVKVYVDCAKRSTEDCVQAFKRRYDELMKFLPIDKEATAKWREAH